MSMQPDWKEVAENLANEVARLNTLLNHISHLSQAVQIDTEKANDVLLAIHDTAAGNTVNNWRMQTRKQEVKE